MNIVIRTDSSIEIGTGHVMRCLTLAKQLKRFGANVVFVCRDLKGNSIKYLQSEGFEVFTISRINFNDDSLDLIKDNWRKDVEETIMLTKNIEIDCVVVDHYSLDRRWEEKMRNAANKILVIDDLANREHDCDYLLDQNYYPNMDSRYMDLVSEDCVLMLGPDYVLLRDEFIEAAKISRERTGEVENLLIFFGGTDPTGETLKTLKSIRRMDSLFKNIDVVVGHANPDKYEIEMLCNEMNNTYFHCQINNMAELMMKADLAIGAGGSTTWERCILGLSTIVIVVANNQKEIVDSVAELNLCINLGEHNNVKQFELYSALRSILKNTKVLKGISDSCLCFLDKSKVFNYPVASIIYGEKE